jgi:hypothetical protein
MSDKKSQFAFTKENYYLMLVGIAVLFTGFILMASDSTTFGFGFLGLTLGPLTVLSGFAIQFLAIFYKAKK